MMMTFVSNQAPTSALTLIDEAEWKPPANKGLCDEADDCRDDQVNDKAEAESPYIGTQFNGDTICQDKR